MDMFSTAVLTGVINQLVPAASHLLDAYFPLIQTETSEEIHFDLVKGGRKIAPFVSPSVPGKVIANRGYETKTFKPAYVKPKYVWTPNRALKRLPGEALLGQMSPQQRAQTLLVQDLQEHRDMVNRRLEVMASEALRTGKVTVAGEDYPTTIVDFGRSSELTADVGAADYWSDTTVDAPEMLKTYAQKVLKASGVFPKTVTMDYDSWAAFRKNQYVVDELKQLASGNQFPLSNEAPDVEGVIYMGSLFGFDFYVYTAWYTDDHDETQDLIPYGHVIMGSVGMKGARAFGAIQDEEAGLAAVECFSKSWVEKDPGQRFVLTQSAPLVVPQLVDASACLTVLKQS